MPEWHVHTMMCGEPRLYGSGETDLIMKTLLKFNKSTDHQYEIKVRWHMPDWHVHTMMCGEPRLYGSGETDLITKTWLRFNKVSRPSIWDQSQVTHAWLTCTHHDVWWT